MEARQKGRVPVVDVAACSGCESCVALCPRVFHRNSHTGLMEVADMDAYPEEAVEEAMAHCPEACIQWESG